MGNNFECGGSGWRRAGGGLWAASGGGAVGALSGHTRTVIGPAGGDRSTPRPSVWPASAGGSGQGSSCPRCCRRAREAGLRQGRGRVEAAALAQTVPRSPVTGSAASLAPGPRPRHGVGQGHGPEIRLRLRPLPARHTTGPPGEPGPCPSAGEPHRQSGGGRSGSGEWQRRRATGSGRGAVCSPQRGVLALTPGLRSACRSDPAAASGQGRSGLEPARPSV